MSEHETPEVYRLRKALRMALAIIDNYEADIRNPDHREWLGVDLVAKGFCQGTIYQGAREFVERIARGEIDP